MHDQGPDLLHLLWLLPTAIGSFGVKFLRDVAVSVAKLNEHIAVLVTRVDGHEEKLDDHEERIRDVESPVHGKLDA